MRTGKGKKDPASAKKKSGVSRTSFKLALLHRLVRSLTKIRVSNKAIIGLAVALEYIICEMIEAAKLICDEEGRKKILTKHLYLAIRKDEELNVFTKHWVLKDGGVYPGSSFEQKQKNDKYKAPAPEL